MAEMYIQGVSTRNVTKIFEEMCGLSVTSDEVSRAANLLDEELEKWRNRPLTEAVLHVFLDATYVKVREDKQVNSQAILMAVGVLASGKRTVLGVSISASESEVHWREFLASLVKRGLHGVKSITSDAHSGLKAALQTVLPSVPWQRCQFHLQQNAQAYVVRVDSKAEVAEDIRTIFNASDRASAEGKLKEVIAKYDKKMPRLAEWMEHNIPEGFTVFAFPKKHQVRLRTNNMVERNNREIKRRTKVVGIFANQKSALRLVSALLAETDEEWGEDKIYLKFVENEKK
jgi:transposase-like protein